MSKRYTLEWHLKGYVLIARMPKTIPEVELDAMDRDFLVHLEQTKGDFLHLVFDLTEQVRMPDLRRMQSLKFVHDARVGWILVAGNIHPVSKFLIVMMAKINRSKFQMFNTMPEAIDFLHSVDSALPVNAVSK